MRLRGSITEIPAEQKALNEVFSLAYEELHRLAAQVRRSDPQATLNSTALVNEAWMKLASSPRLAWASPLHFKRIAARAMRQLLVESARRRRALKRSGALVTFDEAIAAWITTGESSSEDEFLRLDSALDELYKLNERQAAIVESRFSAGSQWKKPLRRLAFPRLRSNGIGELLARGLAVNCVAQVRSQQ